MKLNNYPDTGRTLLAVIICIIAFLLLTLVSCSASRKALTVDTQSSLSASDITWNTSAIDSATIYGTLQSSTVTQSSSSGQVEYFDHSRWEEEVQRRVETILDSLGRPVSVVETSTERKSGRNDVQYNAREEQQLLQHRIDSISEQMDLLKAQLSQYRERQMSDSISQTIDEDEVSGEAAMSASQLFWQKVATYIGILILVLGIAWAARKYFWPI